MKILIFLAAWKRPEITEICFMGINRLKKRFPIDSLCVISEDSMIPLCEKYGIRWTMHENLPLGAKKNHGLNEAMKLEWDYLIEIGSDDLVKDELIELYQQYFGKYDCFGTKDSIVINSETGECIRLKSDTPYGLGRCISRKVIEQHCLGVDVLARQHLLKVGASVPQGQKGFFNPNEAEESEKLGHCEVLTKPKYRLWKDEINKGLDNNSNYFLITKGVGHKAVKTNKPLTIDIKSKENIWPFNKKLGNPYGLEETLEGLSEEEKDAILDLCGLSIAK